MFAPHFQIYSLFPIFKKSFGSGPLKAVMPSMTHYKAADIIVPKNWTAYQF